MRIPIQLASISITLPIFSAAIASTARAEMTPFVIPATQPAHSLAAFTAGNAITTDAHRVMVDGAHFSLDGHRVRFWGVNLTFAADFPSHEDADKLADRLAAGGINAVRLHHMDAHAFTAEQHRGIWNEHDPKQLSAEAMDRLDYLIDRLAARGIYCDLNLHVSRPTAQTLGLPAIENDAYAKVVDLFTPALIDAQKDYATKLLGHENAYRHVKYSADPAIAIVEINNEDSLYQWNAKKYLNAMPAYYGDILTSQFNEWLAKKYGNEQKLAAAWPLGEGESLAGKSVAVFDEHASAARTLDQQAFLLDTETSFWDSMHDFVKNDLQCDAMITGTIVFGPLGMVGQSHMDFIDAHAYWEHPHFPHNDWDIYDWTMQQRAQVDHPEAGTLFGLACSRLAGKPFTVTEYQHPAPNDYQAEGVPEISSFAAAQDWDGVWLFDYGNVPTTDLFHSFFDTGANPAKWGFMSIGAAIFRNEAIAPLSDVRTLSLSPNAKGLADWSADYAKNQTHQFKVFTAMGVSWESMIASRIAVKLAGAPSTTNPSELPDSSKLLWTVEQKQGTYEATGTGAIAWVGHSGGESKSIQLQQPDFASIAMAAMDGKPFAESHLILIAACGKCENEEMTFSKDRHTVGAGFGHAPVSIQAVDATIPLPAGMDKAWTIQPLDADGESTRDPEAVGDAIKLRASDHTMWWALQRK